jgi:hypothetical protein
MFKPVPLAEGADFFALEQITTMKEHENLNGNLVWVQQAWV